MRINFTGGFRIEALFTVQDGLTLRMILQEFLGDEGIGLVRALIVDAALPSVQALIENGIAGVVIFFFHYGG